MEWLSLLPVKRPLCQPALVLDRAKKKSRQTLLAISTIFVFIIRVFVVTNQWLMRAFA
jgi:hypothetical protein